MSEPKLVAWCDREFWDTMNKIFPGLPKDIRRFVLKCEVGKMVTLEIEQLVSIGDKVEFATSRYNLMPVSEKGP